MALTADQIAELSRLLDQAIPLDQESRQRWLDRLPSEHEALVPALRRALFVLEDDSTGGRKWFPTLPRIAEVYNAATLLTAGLQAGQQIGPYRLVRELGAGGMAVVWLAQRADGAFQREVALKLPLLSRLRRDLTERFARERQILAQLEHPNIARLYDAGVAADGLPYLALEYVEGEALTHWCDRHQHSVRERLNVFLQVLDAVQYAHARHVVHRDLKPSNILVTDAGQVRLLDFGVAKLLANREDDAERNELTRVYGRILTPDYASPEQLQGEQIGAASDIYALGVVLYELLVGSRPYRIKAESLDLSLRLAIKEALVRKPSTQVQPTAAVARATTREKLARRLRGDLDAIVLKALAKDPQDRYVTAIALADDIQRYLSGDPVEARPARVGYRFAKFVSRHRLAAGATAVAAVAAIALITWGRADWFAPWPMHTQAAATPNATPLASDKSIAVLPFLDLSEARNQEYFSDGLSDELIDRLARTGDLRVIARTSSFQFKGRNEDVRQIARALGVANVLEGSVRRDGSRIRVTAQLIKASDGSHVWSQTYERDLTDVFKVQDDICSTVANALHAALAGGSAASLTSEHNVEAYNAFLQGWFYYQRATQADLQKSVVAYRQALKLDSKYARAWAELARAYIRQGSWQWDTIEHAYRNARDAAEHALAIDPDQALAHRMLGYVYWDYDLNREAGQAEFAKSRRLDPSDADALSALTIVALAYGRIDEAIELKRRNAEADPLNALMLDDLATLYLDAGRADEAERAVRKALALDPGYTGGHCNLGEVLLSRGQPELALQEMQQESDRGARAGCLPLAYWALGRTADARTSLKLLIDQYADLNAYGIARTFALEAKPDPAFHWLDRAYRQRDVGLSMLKADHLLRGLREDPRFGDLLARMKLAQ